MVAFVQQFTQVSNHWAASASAAAKDLPVAATTGNMIVVVVAVGDGTGTGSVSSIDDAGTTVYQQAYRHTDTSFFGVFIEVWYGFAAGASAGQDVVVTLSGASDSADDYISILEFSGVEDPQLSIQAASIAPSTQTTTHTAGPITPGAADNVLIGVSRGSDNTYTPDADYTNVLDNDRSTLGYKIQATDTAQDYTVVSPDATWTNVVVVAFKGTSAGGPTAYEMTAEPGSYTLTGQVANLLAGGFLSAEAGSYTLIGSEALVDIEMNAEAGSYALNGQDTTLAGTLILTAESGTYDLIGQAVNLLYSLTASIVSPKGQRRMFGFRLNR